VTLQADKTDIGARQHPRIRRAMRLVTRLAAFKAHRSMLERERTALVAMAFEASRLVGREALQHGAGRMLPCGLWQSTQVMPPSGSL
jgi:hypothetical protein